jgi:biotin operon repressor
LSLQKSLQESLQKTLSLIADNPYTTSQQIAEKIGITRVGVAKQLKKIQEHGKLPNHSRVNRNLYTRFNMRTSF